MGDAVNLAARVMSMAVPGQILATGPVLDASSVAFNTVALEPFMVKGKKDPVHAFMVGHSTGSKPETVSREFPLIGRDAEMDAIRRALLELRGGHGSVIELVGNAGMGKTRLLSEFRAEAPDLPNLVSGCEPYESSVAYLPIRRLLRLLLGAGQDVSGLAHRLREDVAHRAPELLPWLPLLAIVADAEVPMTPEVRDLGEEFRKAKLEEVTIDYLASSVIDPTIVSRLVARDGECCVHAATRRAVRYMTAIPAATPPNVAQVSAGSPAFCCERQMRRPTSTITCRIAPMPIARKMVVQKGE
jgi:hypothetical protein